MSKGEYLQYGGQAIIEGVMMRSPNYYAVACRAPNKEIVVRAEPLEKTWIGRQKWLKLPFLRGSWALLDAMTLGTRALRYAAEIQTAPEYQVGNSEAKVENAVKNKKFQEYAVGGAIAFSLIFGLFIFKFVPQLGSTVLQSKYHFSGQVTNGITELIKFLFFLGYLLLISRLKEIQEVFKYHGAEHKAINTLEADQELTMENCEKQTRLHPRCGTSFAMIVLLLGFVVYVFVPRIEAPNVFLTALANFALHVAILPLIAGVAYELLRIAGKFRDESWVMLLFWPGLMTQYITTKEPRPDQIEVALESLKACMAREAEAKAAKAL